MPVLPETRLALRAALHHAGRPRDVAVQLADKVTYEQHDDGPGLQLHGLWVAIDDDQADAVALAAAAETLAVGVVDDNVEAHDRQARGEPGWVPWWPVPGRAPRRR